MRHICISDVHGDFDSMMKALNDRITVLENLGFALNDNGELCQVINEEE